MRLLPQDPGPLIVHTDGAARGNPGPAGVGVHVTDPAGRTVTTLALGIGLATNNVAEYRAAIEGLRLAAERRASHVTLRSDSRLLIEQLAGRFKVKNARLRALHQEARSLMRRFDQIVLEHVPRGDNAEADALANEGVDDWLAAGGGHPDPDQQPPLFDG